MRSGLRTGEVSMAAKSKKPPPRIIRAWIGFTDDKPYVFRNDHGQDEWCVFTNREHARQAFEDVRRCDVVIEQSKDRGGEHG
jgi:hypothetical protein